MNKGDKIRYLYNNEEYVGTLYSLKYTADSSVVDTLGGDNLPNMIGRYLLIPRKDIFSFSDKCRIKRLPYEQGII